VVAVGSGVKSARFVPDFLFFWCRSLAAAIVDAGDRAWIARLEARRARLGRVLFRGFAPKASRPTRSRVAAG